MRNIVLSFFDYTGEAVKPWAAMGYTCYCFDIQHKAQEVRLHGLGRIILEPWDATKPLPAWLYKLKGQVAMTFGFPPCTDLAASGARHWEAKRKADPYFQDRAANMAQSVALTAIALKSPYCIENPNGALSRLWRKPDHRFDPCEYGGYLKAGEVHPTWPEYIPVQDAYTKHTCLWTGRGFVMPPKRPVDPVRITYKRADGSETSGSPAWAKLGGKSLKTKNIWSAAPRGFALAVCYANADVKDLIPSLDVA